MALLGQVMIWLGILGGQTALALTVCAMAFRYRARWIAANDSVIATRAENVRLSNAAQHWCERAVDLSVVHAERQISASQRASHARRCQIEQQRISKTLTTERLRSGI